MSWLQPSDMLFWTYCTIIIDTSYLFYLLRSAADGSTSLFQTVGTNNLGLVKTNLFKMPLNAKLCVVCALLFYAEIVHGESLTLNTVLNNCSRTLSDFIFQICTGVIPVSGFPAPPSNVRSKRAAIFLTNIRNKRQIADECCLAPCSISQLLEYCPENWWMVTRNKWYWLVLLFGGTVKTV